MPLNNRQAEFKGWIKRQFFDKSGVLTFDVLESKATALAKVLYPDLSAIEIGEVVKELTQENNVKITLGDSIVDLTTFRPWIARRREKTETPRWNAYRDLLISRDWEENFIKKIDEQTDDVVELLGDPTQVDGVWPRRGLLMGEVQSGKTATYLGILNKALDYGYRVIVVIGGHTEDLRRQTQMRFDTDLLGIDSETWEDGINSAAIRYVGVGRISGLRAHLMTTARHDFSRSKRSSSITWVDGGLPTVFITKKTPALLNNIREYIKSQAPGGRLDIPLIVVDDESDWGSPNTRDKADPTSVNRAIRALLDVSKRSSYLAITATPFANIFIDDQASFQFVEKKGQGKSADNCTGTVLQDLFPSDYIRVMSTPGTYLGVGTYFGEGGNATISTAVDDCLELIPIKHKNNYPVLSMPESMEIAVIDFLLGTAVRCIRDQKMKAASMLINVSRFKSVERQVSELVRDFLQRTVTVILGEFARQTSNRSNAANRIQEVWHKRFGEVSDVAWNQVASTLVEIASCFRVELINGDTAKDRAKRRKQMTAVERDEDDLIPKIVVGGDILSRGLTLEGLQVSYFVREPRAMDTLLQMGRWFGYRHRFDDLVRIWMPESTRADFSHAAEVTEELRETLHDMKARGLRPKDFGLRVRIHPDSVDIVAANKGRSTEFIDIGPVVWQNRLAESYDLVGEDELDSANRDAVENLIAKLGSKESSIKTYGNFDSWHDVPLDMIFDFFRVFQGDRHGQWQWFGRRGDGTLPISDAFRAAPGSDRWSVVLVSGDGGVHNFGPFSVNMSRRNRMKRSLSDGHIRLENRRVVSGKDLVKALVESEYEAMDGKNSSTSKNIALLSQSGALASLTHPILMVYAVTADEPSGQEDADFERVKKDLTRIAVAIAFPKMTQEQIEDATRESKTYQVNQVYWRAYNGFVEDLGDDVILEEDT